MSALRRRILERVRYILTSMSEEHTMVAPITDASINPLALQKDVRMRLGVVAIERGWKEYS